MERDAKILHLCNRILTQANEKLKHIRHITIRYYVLKITIACIFLLLIIIVPVILGYLVLPLVPVAIVMVILLSGYDIKKDSDYAIAYRNLIIKPIIKEVFKDAEYVLKTGLRPSQYDRKIGIYDKSALRVDKETKKYKKLHYPVLGNFETLSKSEDRIVTNQPNSLIFSEVNINGFSETRGIGPIYKSYKFSGIAGTFKSPINFQEIIRISKDSFEFGKNLKMDSEEFERNFNLHTNDRLKAYTILTPDVMLKLINCTKKFDNTLELALWEDRVYFRMAVDRFFDINLNPNDIDINTLVEYYNLLCEIKSLTDEVDEILSSANI